MDEKESLTIKDSESAQNAILSFPYSEVPELPSRI